MTLRRRHFLQLATSAVALPAHCRAWHWRKPIRREPVKLIVTVPAGGSPDIIGRLIAQRTVGNASGSQFFVDNQAGRSTNLGTEICRPSRRPTATRCCLPCRRMRLMPSLYHHLNFELRCSDAVPVASIATIPLVLDVNPAVPAKTVAEFIAYAKANPGKINLASGGIGTPLMWPARCSA